MSKQGYFTILLDENLRGLESALEDDGFKVVMPPPGLKDDPLKRMARGWAILTKNSKDFVDDAARFDYDVIDVEAIRFIDSKPDRTNDTVRKISQAVRRSGIGSTRGNFWLQVRDDAAFIRVNWCDLRAVAPRGAFSKSGYCRLSAVSLCGALSFSGGKLSSRGCCSAPFTWRKRLIAECSRSVH
ncbi:MAG: hypothetical protein JO099_19050 [Acidobacteriia bacterium]|nr:hypothetical protein [Terriglobia bacterium]